MSELSDDARREDAQPEDGQLADPHAEPEIVATHAHRGEAEVTKAHLAANGVDAEIIDGVEGGTVPVDGQDGVYVMVAADQAEVARAFLADDNQADDNQADDNQ
jgi:hypothetical protein